MILFSRYKEGMSKQDCMDLVLTAVTMAIRRDGSSGGCCRMAIITKVRLLTRVVPNID